MKNLFFLLVLFSLGFIGCSDDQQYQEFEPQITNSNNPYDFIGKNHNEALLFAAGKIDIYRSSNLELYNAIHQFGNEETYIPVTEIPHIATIEDYCPSGCDFDSYVRSAGIIDKARLANFEKLQELVFIPNFKKSDTPEIISNIIAYENELLQKEELNSTILGTISIMRHSLDFWYTANKDESHLIINGYRKMIFLRSEVLGSCN
jgi:hypothetical protein